MATAVTLQEENGDGERASKRMRGGARPHTSEDEVLQADSADSLAASPTGGAPTEVGLAGHIKDFLSQFASSDDEEYAPREAAAPILLVSAEPQPRAHIHPLVAWIQCVRRRLQRAAGVAASAVRDACEHPVSSLCAGAYGATSQTGPRGWRPGHAGARQRPKSGQADHGGLRVAAGSPGPSLCTVGTATCACCSSSTWTTIDAEKCLTAI